MEHDYSLDNFINSDYPPGKWEETSWRLLVWLPRSSFPLARTCRNKNSPLRTGSTLFAPGAPNTHKRMYSKSFIFFHLSLTHFLDCATQIVFRIQKPGDGQPCIKRRRHVKRPKQTKPSSSDKVEFVIAKSHLL